MEGRSKNGGRGGGGLINSKVILVPQKYLTKLQTFDPMSQKYPANVFQNWRKTHFLLHFHVCCFSNHRYEGVSRGVFTLRVSNQNNNLDIGQKPYLISLFFFALYYKH